MNAPWDPTDPVRSHSSGDAVPSGPVVGEANTWPTSPGPARPPESPMAPASTVTPHQAPSVGLGGPPPPPPPPVTGLVRQPPAWSPPNPPPPWQTPTAPAPGRGARPGLVAVAILVVAALLAAGFVAGRVTSDSGPAQAQGPSASDLREAGLPTEAPVRGNPEEAVAAVAEALSPAVVQIETGLGLGSGVVYDPEGLLLTNNHVVEGSDEVIVRFADGSAVDGEVLGADPSSDIAVVQVPTDAVIGVAVLALGEEVRVGQTAVAIGSPFGFDQTVTSGIISAVGRPFPNEAEEILVGMLQTDAPINQGNSGGALANREGKVIGINTAIASVSGDNNGLGFAVPIDLAYERAERLATGEDIETAVLGVMAPDADEDDNVPGALIGEVDEQSGAYEAGMRDGDVVTAIDGQPVRDFGQLAIAIFRYLPGDTIDLTVERDGETLTLEATLGVR